MTYYSQNGYSVISRGECKFYDVSGISLPLRPDDCGYLLARFSRQFDKRVETLGHTETFGHSERKISGTNEWSNHASGTAVDLNSARHPYGAEGTFSAAEESEIYKLLDNFDDVIRWGGTYRYSKDEMHFEIARPYAEVKLLAAVFRRKNVVYLKRLQYGKRNLDVYMVKRALHKAGFFSGTMNNYFSREMEKAYAAWQVSLGYTGSDADGVPGPASLVKLGFTVK